MNDCSFCGLPVFIAGATEHPCCTFARARGDARCAGCEAFRNARRRA